MVTLVIATLLSGWALVQVHRRMGYRCPACGSRRPDGHSRECQWSSRR
jgi:hypothetical protein